MKLTVFTNQYGFSTLAKNGDDKMYVSVQFKRGNEPTQEKARIEIKDAFFSMYKNKAGFAFPKLVIMDYEVIEENKSDFVPQFTDNDIPPLDDDELPF